MFKKFVQIMSLIAVFFVTSLPMSTASAMDAPRLQAGGLSLNQADVSLPMFSAYAMDASANKSCPLGYVLKNGKCQPIEITQNEKLSRLAHCAANHGQTVKSFNACMKNHRGNNQIR
jgi:hypothetical protein